MDYDTGLPNDKCENLTSLWRDEFAKVLLDILDSWEQEDVFTLEDEFYPRTENKYANY